MLKSKCQGTSGGWSRQELSGTFVFFKSNLNGKEESRKVRSILIPMSGSATFLVPTQNQVIIPCQSITLDFRFSSLNEGFERTEPLKK